jgi:hypothetical protein
VTVAPIILSSDKTILGHLSGKASAWPVYMSVGNIKGFDRFRKQKRVMRLIALLPSVKGNGLFGPTEHRGEI